MIFNTRSYRGNQTKRPSITTNEGADKKYVKISSEIIMNPDSTYPIIIKPYKFDVSQFGEKERKKLEFEIFNVSSQDLAIKLLDMPANMFKLKLPKKVKAGKSEKGTIEILDEYVSEEFEKSLTVELSDDAMTRFTVPVKRTIRIPGAGKSSEHSKK